VSGESANTQKMLLAAAIAEGTAVAKWASSNVVPERTAYYWAEEPGLGQERQTPLWAERPGLLLQQSADMFNRDPCRPSQALPVSSKSEECASSSRFGGSNVPVTGELHRRQVATNLDSRPNDVRADQSEVALKAFPTVPNCTTCILT
jgi:hypothetical protein